MKAKYNPHHKADAQGHIFLEKEGPCTIQLIGAASMKQEELNAFGEFIAKALAKFKLPEK